MKDTTKRNLTIGAGVSAALPLAANALVPGLGRNLGLFKGYPRAVKSIYWDLPNILAKHKNLSNVIGYKNALPLSLPPNDIIQRSMQRANVTKLTPENWKTVKQFDQSSTKELLREREEQLRQSGASHVLSFSHFIPQVAARLGYKVDESIHPAVARAMSTAIYERLKIQIRKANVLKGQKLEQTDPNSIYLFTIRPHKGAFMYTKRLDIPHEQAVTEAMDRLKRFKPETLAGFANTERKFKKDYDVLLSKWIEANQ